MLYHLTPRANVDAIRSSGMLRSAHSILQEAEEGEHAHARRRSARSVRIGTQLIKVQDQRPLAPGNVELLGGWTFEDFVRHLNSHVFCWPGTLEGPTEYGRRHFARYAPEDPAVLVIDAAEMIVANTSNPPCFSRFNSGSPRCNRGRKSPRGPDLFLPADTYGGTPGSVVEVTFRGHALLPERAYRVTDTDLS